MKANTAETRNSSDDIIDAMMITMIKTHISNMVKNHEVNNEMTV